MVTAIILAAGHGTRMGTDTPKQFLKIKDTPLIARTLRVFEDSPEIDAIVLVTSEDYRDYCRSEIVERYGLTKVKQIIQGGAERYDSVYAGLLACEQIEKTVAEAGHPEPEKSFNMTQTSESRENFKSKKYFDPKKDATPESAAGNRQLPSRYEEDSHQSYVMIHDGARPFVTEDILRRILADVRQYGASVVGVPSKDTIKIADDSGFISSTPLRDHVWNIQTPQAFELSRIKKAYKIMRARGMEGITDDAMCIERAGLGRVHLVMGAYENVKITTPDDLKYLSE